MRNKHKILRIISSLDPKYGGPQAGILSSSNQLIKEGFKVDILTLDKKKINYPKKKFRIINFNSYIGKNYKFSLKLFFWILKHQKNYDLFLIHGLWQFNTLLARVLLKKKYYVFIHGQLDPFFRFNFFKSIKKKIYWFLIEKSNLKNSKSILLTTDQEKKLIKKTYVNTDGINKNVVKYGILRDKINKKECLKRFYSKFENLKNKQFYLYLGRYHEKKGCDIIIKSIKKLSKNFQSCILMAGPLNDTSYEKYLRNLIKKNNLQDKIIMTDALFNKIKWGAIIACRAMFLASHGENFGISVVESLSMKKPVIITNKVNIHNYVLKYNAGYIALNNTESFSNKIDKFENIGGQELFKMSNNAYKCFEENFNISNKANGLGKFLKNEILKKNDNEQIF